MSKSFTLRNNQTGEEVELPVLEGTMGPDVIDIQKLYAQTGHFTFDPGFTSTASCESGLTYIDGGKGQLEHRGYDIFELAEKADYLTVCYLLLYGELPTSEQKQGFDRTIRSHTMLHEQLLSFFKGYRRGAHPMAIMTGVVGALSAFYHDSTDINDPQQRELAALRMLAKMPTIGACAYKYSIGQPFIYPDNSLSFAGNLLKMLFAIPSESFELNPVLERAMDRVLTLHADHEQNASTSTVRLAASSQANPFACIAAGIASLWGPAHGGANQAVLEMLEEIGDPSRVAEFVARAKDPEDSYRLMGFGHRVYKNFDPRAKVMRETAHEVLRELGIEDSPELEIAMALEKIALEDEYFIERKLYPNVDFYSGIILSAMGFPTNMFTVVFAIGRTVGWIAHWKEMMRDNPRIGRPRQLYTGPESRPYVDIKDR